MTYPPQPGQPGPDPYGQQPDPYGGQGGQPGQFGQQPGQFGAQPGQPGQFGYQPTAQFGQPTTQFGPATGYDGGYYPSGPAGPPPKKRGPGMITAAVAGAVLVLGGAGTGVYFLTKSDDQPSNTASTGQQTSSAKSTSTSRTAPRTSRSTAGNETGTATSEAPTGPTTPGGGGGTEPGDAEIVEVATKYAKAVNDRDEAAAKAVTCNNDAGILFQSSKIEVTGKPEKFDESSAAIDVEVTVGTEKIPDFPLFMDKKPTGWCVT